MKCSNCGRELKEGHLYCDYCGQEIRIVPDIDLEIENSIQETMTTLAEDFAPSAKRIPQGGSASESGPNAKSAEEKEADRRRREENRKKQRRTRWALAGVSLVCLAALTVFITVYVYQGRSFEYQLKKAVSCAAGENYEQAILYLNKAVSLNDKDIDARLLLAEYYTKNEDYKSAKDALRELIAISPENTQAYERLIALYERDQDYEAVSRLVEASGSDKMKERFRRYTAPPPEFGTAEGSYSEVVALKLSSGTSGTIYYTTDGAEPGVKSERYTAPIMLENGDYSIRAVFVNEYGIESECVTKNYHITVAVPLAPTINVLSGSYSRPVMITAEAAPDCTVYYTLDGTAPTQAGIQYTVPVAMPLGSSTFRFIAYNEDGVASEETERRYVLSVPTAVNVEQAVNLLVQGLTERGVLLEYDGTVSGKSGKNIYIASTLINIGENDFFLIVEYYRDTIGTLTKTGNLYGVEAAQGTIYKITTDEKGSYLANPL